MRVRVKVEPFCWRDPERSRRGEPRGETLSEPSESNGNLFQVWITTTVGALSWPGFGQGRAFRLAHQLPRMHHYAASS